MTPQIVSTLLALGIFSSIFWLVRKDYLVQRDGVKWIFIAIAVLLYGLNPALNDKIGLFLGVGYPPIIVVLLGLGAVLIKLLIADIERTKLQISVTRLIQKVAILESELEWSQKSPAESEK